jgi:lipopolysaccharide export LptBFGC system permease protein LptF
MSAKSFIANYSKTLLAVSLSLVAIFFILAQLHSHFGGNIVGTTADTAAQYINGSKWNF